MHHFLKKYIVLLLLLISVVAGYSQQLPDSMQDVRVITEDTSYYDSDSTTTYENEEADMLADSLQIILRTLPPDSITRIRTDRQYLYAERFDSLMRADAREQEKKPPPPTETAAEPRRGIFEFAAVRTILWLLAGAAVLFVIYKIFLGGGGFAANKRISQPQVNPEDADDDIHTSEIERLINKAVAAKNWRLATRYLYIQSLQMLGARGYITLAAQKTNQEYLREMTGKKELNDFSRLTLQYEYVWYGGFDINENQFAQVHQFHQQFNKSI